MSQRSRVKSVNWVARPKLQTRFSIHFVPSAVYQPESGIHTTLAAAKAYHFDTRKQLFELTENEALTAADHLVSVIKAYREVGFQVALNDFDAGQLRINVAVASPLNLIKLDVTLLCVVERNNNQ